MTPAEAVIAEVGGFLLAGGFGYLGFLALKRNYIKVTFSASIAKPADRVPPAPAEPEPAAETGLFKSVGAA